MRGNCNRLKAASAGADKDTVMTAQPVLGFCATAEYDTHAVVRIGSIFGKATRENP